MDYEKDNLLSETRDNWRIGYAKKLLAFGVSEECRSALEKEFPELKESEDEMIRNLIYCIVRDRSDVGKLLEANGCPVEKALSWIEKHKEQKAVSQWKPHSYETMEITNVVRQALQECERYSNINPTYYAARVGATVEEIISKQKPAEWSEEDEKMLEKCVGYMTKITPIPDKERFVRFETTKDEGCINWLKSLRPQPHWKPSEEQMEALKEAITDAEKSLQSHINDWRFSVLLSLRNDLKML